MTDDHPDNDDLVAYLRSPEETPEDVREHLATCETCVTTMNALIDDDNVLALLSAPVSDGSDDDGRLADWEAIRRRIPFRS